MSEIILWQNIEKVATITNVGELVNKLQEKQLRIDKPRTSVLSWRTQRLFEYKIDAKGFS